MKRILLSLVAFFLVGQVFSQIWLSNILAEVEQNNPIIKSGLMWKDAKHAEASTGITPANPFVHAGWFPAEDKGNGVKKTWGITQSFDFPTLYFQKVKRANTSKAIADIEYKMLRQEILLDAKSTIIELIYAKRTISRLQERANQTQKLVSWFQKKHETGDASILELNNAQTRFLEINDKLLGVKNRFESLSIKLVQMNGGNAIFINDTTISIPILQNQDSLIEAMKNSDPRFVLLSVNVQQSSQNISIAKQQWLPNFEVGYESEKTNTETFTGFKVGLSLPLWSNTGQVKAAKAKGFAIDADIVNIKLQLTLEVDQEYTKANNTLKRYQNLDGFFKSNSNYTLLKKSLEAGNISSINFFNEVEYLYELEDKYYDFEKDYILSIASLERFKL